MTMFTGQADTSVFAAIAIKHALRMMQRGMSPNAGWTNTKTVAKVNEICGTNHKRSDLAAAEQSIAAWIEKQKEARA